MGFDLNCAPVDQYPVIKVLTKSDMTTSQLVLPRHAVEESIVPNMPQALKERLRGGDGRANIWVVDDENCLEHFLTMVDRDHRYSIISWGHVRQTRELRVGEEMRFGWMNQKLHFIVTPEVLLENNKDGDSSRMAENDEQNSEQEGERIGENTNDEQNSEQEGERIDKNTNDEQNSEQEGEHIDKNTNDEQNSEQEGERIDKNTDEPPAKKRKDMDETKETMVEKGETSGAATDTNS